jgi:sugar/nucleoside kinase (ribokinase family)
MNSFVMGTLAFDSVETPYDRRDDALGGSAAHFAQAARQFGGLGLVAVIGADFPEAELEAFAAEGIDCSGVERLAGETFRWGGRYEADWNTRHTLYTDLNVLSEFDPKVPEGLRGARYVFLANTAPALQIRTLEQCSAPKFVVADTMNLWIDTARDDLLELLRRVQGVVLNDEEARMLTGEGNLQRAARAVLALGPQLVILKKGEHGAFLCDGESTFSVPAYPVEEVVDPTGAGDSFAGGFMGYVASVDNAEPRTLRRAMLYGTVTASLCVEAFSFDGLRQSSRARVESRFNELLAMVTP